ncbi:hypothetical protein ACFE04_022850 [Oxalis oulophora]
MARMTAKDEERWRGKFVVEALTVIADYTDVPASLKCRIGLDDHTHIMSSISSSVVVNLFVDQSQVMDLKCLYGCNLGKNHTFVLGPKFKDPWVEEEDMILIDVHQKLRKKWTKISKRLLGGPENTVKNHWNVVKRKQIFPKGRVYHCFSVVLKAC